MAREQNAYVEDDANAMNMGSVCALDGKCSMIMDNGHNRAFDAQKCQKYKKLCMCPVK